MDLPRFNQLLLELHRIGREVALPRFQPAALDLIRNSIPFDSAWWGNAAAEPLEIHRLYLYNCDDSILNAYLPYMDQDFMRAALMASPGKSINLADLTTRARFVRTPLYRNVGKRYRIEWSVGTLLVEPISSLNEFLTIWRHDPKRPFSEAERQTKELLMPHLADAHRLARLREVLDDPRARQECWAIADERGFLREIEPGFVHFLRQHWPNWQGSRLPDALIPAVREARPVKLGARNLHVDKRGAFRYLQVIGAHALDELTSREREIAQRYARGQTYAAIASNLGVSPSTVRNHIAHCYRKLAVNNKVELARRILMGTVDIG